jgi:hypothetical protein
MSDRITTRAKRSIQSSVTTPETTAAIETTRSDSSENTASTSSKRRSNSALLTVASKQLPPADVNSNTASTLSKKTQAENDARTSRTPTTPAGQSKNTAARGSSHAVENEPTSIIDHDSESNSSQLDSVKRSKRLRQTSTKYLGSVYTTLDVPNKRAKLAQAAAATATSVNNDSTTPAKRVQSASSLNRSADLTESNDSTAVNGEIENSLIKSVDMTLTKNDSNVKQLTQTSTILNSTTSKATPTKRALPASSLNRSANLNESNNNASATNDETETSSTAVDTAAKKPIITQKITKSRSKSQVVATMAEPSEVEQNLKTETTENSPKESIANAESISLSKENQIIQKDNAAATDEGTSRKEIQQPVEQLTQNQITQNNNISQDQPENLQIVASEPLAVNNSATHAKTSDLSSTSESARIETNKSVGNNNQKSVQQVVANLGEIVMNCKLKLGILSSSKALSNVAIRPKSPQKSESAKQPNKQHEYRPAVSLSVEEIPAPPTTTPGKKKQRLANSTSLTSLAAASLKTEAMPMVAQPTVVSPHEDNKNTLELSSNSLGEPVSAVQSEANILYTLAKKLPTKRPKILKSNIANCISGNYHRGVIGNTSANNSLNASGLSVNSTVQSESIPVDQVNFQQMATTSQPSQSSSQNASAVNDERLLSASELKRKKFLDAVKTTYNELFKEVKLNTGKQW